MNRRLPISSLAFRERLQQLKEFGPDTLDRFFQTWSCDDCDNQFETGGLASFLLPTVKDVIASASSLREWVVAGCNVDETTCPSCDERTDRLLSVVLVSFSSELEADVCFEFVRDQKSSKWLTACQLLSLSGESERISLADSRLGSLYREAMHRYVATLLEVEGDGVSALRLLDSCDEIFSQGHRSIYLRGTILRETNEFDASVACFQKLLDIETPQKILYEIGLTHFAAISFGEDKLVEAFAVFSGLVEIDPEFASAHLYLGNVQLALDDFKSAKSSFDRAIECDPKMLAAHFNSALISISQKDLAGAVLRLETARQIAPNDLDVLAKLKCCYLDLDDQTKVIELETVIENLTRNKIS